MTAMRFSAVLLGSAALLASSALAGPANKKSFHLPETVVVEGKTLAPGDYKIEWSEAGQDAQVNILRGKDTVATFPAHVVSVNNTILKDGYSTASSQDGSKVLTQLFFSGKKYELQVQTAAAGATAQTADTAKQN